MDGKDCLFQNKQMDQILNKETEMDLLAMMEKLESIDLSMMSSEKSGQNRGLITMQCLKEIFKRCSTTWQATDQTKFDAKIWTEELSQFNDNIIKKSLMYCKDNLKWHPNLAEFRQICLREQRNSHGYIESPIRATKETDYSVKRIIDEGAQICKKIKQIYPDASWTRISRMFTVLKEKSNTP